jgi:hypothetical protein
MRESINDYVKNVCQVNFVKHITSPIPNNLIEAAAEVAPGLDSTNTFLQM